MAEAILLGKNRMFPASVLLKGQYGYENIFLGVPCIIGTGGLVKIVDLKLTAEEKTGLDKSANAVSTQMREVGLVTGTPGHQAALAKGTTGTRSVRCWPAGDARASFSIASETVASKYCSPHWRQTVAGTSSITTRRSPHLKSTRTRRPSSWGLWQK
jgi:hypothetical protein